MQMGKEMTPFGRKLELLMARRGMNPGELSKKIGISVRNVCQLKRTAKPRPKTIYLCAQALGVDVEFFLDLD
jgi:DNA-binding Xre family transcriptional regulator